MCFSASASFGAGAVLSVIGIASLKKAKIPSQVPFASIPLIFAAQQISEGVLWLSIPDPEGSSLQVLTTYLFLFFAQVVWPAWVPFSILKLETNEKRKKVLKILTGMGCLVSFYLAFCLAKYHVHAAIIGYHISYIQDYPATISTYGGLLYVIATIAPPFCSSVKRMSYLGMAILISYIITTLFYKDYIVSVWCFFASVISITVYFIVRGIKTPAAGRSFPEP